MQVREPYLIFRLDKKESDSNSQKIRGIWFHNGKEREKVKAVLDRVVRSLSDAQTATENNDFSKQVGKSTSKADTAASLLSTLALGDKIDDTQVQTSSSNGNIDPQNMVLDKRSLQLSLMSLIQDDRFLDLLHAQYLKVARARETKKMDSSNP